MHLRLCELIKLSSRNEYDTGLASFRFQYSMNEKIFRKVFEKSVSADERRKIPERHKQFMAGVRNLLSCKYYLLALMLAKICFDMFRTPPQLHFMNEFPCRGLKVVHPRKCAKMVHKPAAAALTAIPKLEILSDSSIGEASINYYRDKLQSFHLILALNRTLMCGHTKEKRLQK